MDARGRFWVVFPVSLVFCVKLSISQGSLVQGSIEGTITKAGSDIGIKGVEVFASKDRTRVGTTTDPSGHFVLSGLDAGQYSIRAERTGYVAQTHGERKNNPRGVRVELKAGQKIDGIDFHLLQSGVITGRVIGEDNEPRVGAFVEALVYAFRGGQRRLVTGGSGTTNDLGEYRIYGLRPDRYYVVVTTLGAGRMRQTVGEHALYVPTYYGNVSVSSQAVPVEVSPGSELRRIDISALQSQNYHVRGQLLGVDKTSRFSRIWLLSADPHYNTGEVPTKSDGSFDIAAVFPGSYILYASFLRDGAWYKARQPIEVAGSTVENVSVSPRPPLDIVGSVSVEGKESVDFQTFALHVTSDEFDPEGLGNINTKITSEGQVVFKGAYNRPYEIAISGMPDTWYLKSIRLGDEIRTDGTLDLSNAGGAPKILEILISPNGGQIDGVVKREDGVAVENAVVDLVPNRDPRSIHRFRETVSDRNGRFVLKGIAPGEYKLFAWEDIESGAVQDPVFLKRYENDGEGITIGAGSRETRDVHMLTIQTDPQY